MQILAPGKIGEVYYTFFGVLIWSKAQHITNNVEQKFLP